jgi:hypothetical protein
MTAKSVLSAASTPVDHTAKRAQLDHLCTHTFNGPCVTRKIQLVLRFNIVFFLLPLLLILLLIRGIENNLGCWRFFDFLNTEVFAIPRKKSPNLLSAGREPNATCSNQDFS